MRALSEAILNYIAVTGLNISRINLLNLHLQIACHKLNEYVLLQKNKIIMDLDSFYIYNIISITRRYRSLMDTYPNRFYYIIAQLINDFFQRNTT